VGDGRFLFDLQRKWNTSSLDEFNIHLYGLDINEVAIAKCEDHKLTLDSKIRNIFDFKVGNALLGYTARPELTNIKSEFPNLDKTFFELIDRDNSEIKSSFHPFHWFYEWPEPGLQGGYDICIGNPPFGISFSKNEKFMYKQLYKAIDPEIESYLLFVERSIEILKEEGLLVLLLPNNFTTNLRYVKFRKFLLENLVIKQIIMLKENIFPQVSVEPCILVGYKKTKVPLLRNNKIEFSTYSVREGFSERNFINQSTIMNQKLLFLLPSDDQFFQKIRIKIENNSIQLGEIVNISRGIELGFNSSRTSDNPISTSSVPLVACRNIHPFFIDDEIRHIEFDTNQKAIFKDKTLYLQPKILLRRIGHDLIGAFDDTNLFCVCDVYILTAKPQRTDVNFHHLESILNSSILTYYLNQEFKSVKKIFPKIPINYLRKLPIKLPFSENISREIDNLLKRSDNVLKEFTRRKIDQLLSTHYGITKEQHQLLLETLANR
jgi:hypothetical protein